MGILSMLMVLVRIVVYGYKKASLQGKLLCPMIVPLIWEKSQVVAIVRLRLISDMSRCNVGPPCVNDPGPDALIFDVW